MVTQLDEWRRHPVLPIAGAMGYATGSMLIHGLGPYLQPFTREFGWTVTQVTVSLTITTLSHANGKIHYPTAQALAGANH